MKRLCIVGVGLIGGSIGLAVKARNLPYHVVGVESNAAVWGDALRLGAVDEITNDLTAGVKDADLVILAVPVGAVLELLPRLAPLIGMDTVVTDTGSVKTAIAEEGFAHLGDRFVPGHPMAGSEKGGVLAARADLFAGATWAITPQSGKAGRFATFIRSLGAMPYILPAENHDRIVALTSHVPHVLAYLLSAKARQDFKVTHLAGGSWRDVTRVAASPPDLWTQIAAQNAAPLAQTLRAVASELEAIADALETGDIETVAERFAEGHAAKMCDRSATAGESIAAKYVAKLAERDAQP